MNKKIMICIILFLIFIFTIACIYKFSNNEYENNTENNINNENILENEQENINNSVEPNIQNTMPTNENVDQMSQNTGNNIEKTIVNQVSPSGFMGSSLYRVALYSNGEVYLQIYDGNGYEEKNIVSNDLIAKNVVEIKEAKDDEHLGEISIKGGEAIKKDIGWIYFE